MADKLAEISIAAAAAEFDALIGRVEAGDTIIITRDGQPVACIRPLPIYRTAASGFRKIKCPRFRWPP
jgi:antitoxin (DNA-binding transcriptional repressor) of toxin-antitoxin stability system